MTATGPRSLALGDLAIYNLLARATACWADHGYEGSSSRSGKALGIGELLTSACSASATLDRS